MANRINVKVNLKNKSENVWFVDMDGAENQKNQVSNDITKTIRSFESVMQQFNTLKNDAATKGSWANAVSETAKAAKKYVDQLGKRRTNLNNKFTKDYRDFAVYNSKFDSLAEAAAKASTDAGDEIDGGVK